MARGKGSRLMVGKVKAKATAGEVVSMCRWRRETSTIWMHNMLDDCRGVSWRAGSKQARSNSFIPVLPSSAQLAAAVVNSAETHPPRIPTSELCVLGASTTIDCRSRVMRASALSTIVSEAMAAQRAALSG